MADSFRLKALITGVDKLSPALSRIQKNMRSFRRDLNKGSAGAVPLAAGLVAGLTGATMAYAKQEAAATGLKVAMMDSSGSAGPEFEKINQLATGLGNTLPGTTADFQTMMQTLIRQGVPAASILNGVGEASAYLAVQLNKTPEAAAEFAAKMQDATGTASKDMMGLFDTIQKVFYMGVDDASMLAFFGKTSSVLKMVSQDGLTAAKALAPLSVMMDQAGMKGEASGNALRKVLQAGFDGKKMNAANKLLHREGITLDFTDGKGEFSGLDNLFNQLEKLQSLTTGQRTGVIKTIFGDDAETLQGVNTLITKGKQGYDDIRRKMDKQASLQQRVAAQLGTLTNLWEAMTGTAVNGLAAIGGAFSGEMKQRVTLTGESAAWFSEFVAVNPAVIRGAIGLAAGFVVVKLAILGVSMAVALMNKTIGLSPLGVFIRLAAMGAGLILANWGTLGPGFKTLWNSVTAEFTLTWELIKARCADGLQWINALLSGFHPLDIITERWEPLIAWFKSLWERISVYTGPLFSAVNKVKGWTDEGWTAVSGDENRGHPASPGLSPQYNHYLPSGQQKVNGELTVKFDNAPPGMNVVTARSHQPGFGISYDVGYNRFARQR